MSLAWADTAETPRDAAVRLWYDKIDALEKAEGRPATAEELERMRAEAYNATGAQDI